MRKQYHLRPSSNGFMAWDIDKLVASTNDLVPIQVNVQDIKELDENYWYNGPNDVPTCRSMTNHMKLALQADPAYPIILSAEGRVMDGMHRILKALILGINELKAYKFKVTPPPDYIDISPSDLKYE